VLRFRVRGVAGIRGGQLHVLGRQGEKEDEEERDGREEGALLQER